MNLQSILQISTAEGETARSETPSSNATPNANSSMGNTTPTPQTPTSTSSTPPSSQNNSGTTTPPTTTTNIGPDEEEVEPPAIVVYMVEPFSLGGAEDPDRRRLAILALLRAYSAAVNSMPENIRSNINVQVKGNLEITGRLISYSKFGIFPIFMKFLMHVQCKNCHYQYM